MYLFKWRTRWGRLQPAAGFSPPPLGIALEDGGMASACESKTLEMMQDLTGKVQNNANNNTENNMKITQTNSGVGVREWNPEADYVFVFRTFTPRDRDRGAKFN
jgi:hypothetical protein